MPKAKTVIVDGHLTSTKTITEVDLAEVETARSKLAAIRSAARKAEAEAKALENDIICRLKAGAKVTGNFTAIVERTNGARRPEWKDLFLDHMAAAHGVSRDALEKQTIENTVGEPKDVLVIGVKPGK